MVFPTFFNLSLNLAVRSSWSEPQSPPSLVFADYIKLLHLWLQTEDEMVGWHHRHNGHRFGWTPGVSDGQGCLACCGSWGRKESDTTEQLNWTELIINLILVLTIWWGPCVESSYVVGRGCLLWPVCSLGRTLLAFVLLHSVPQGQFCLFLQVFVDFLLLHSYNEKDIFWGH